MTKIYLVIHKNQFVEIYLITLLLFLMRPFAGLIQVGGIDVIVLISFAMMIYPTIYLCLNSNQAVQILIRMPLLFALVVCASASILWSKSIGSTLEGVANLLGSTVLAMFIIIKFSFRDQIRIFFVTLTIAGVISLCISLLIPSLGQSVARGADTVWRGVFTHKNGLGRMMAIYCAFAWYYWRLERHTVKITILALVGGVLLVLASSATSLLACLISILGMSIYRQISGRMLLVRWGILLLGIGVSLALSIVLFADFWLNDFGSLVTLIGRDSDQNSFLVRLTLWGQLFEYGREQLWIGYGYNAFWDSLTNSNLNIDYFGNGNYWLPDHAHNGYLELFLQLGLLGLVGTLTHLTLILLQLFRLSGDATIARTELYWGLVIMIIIFNVTYTTLLGQLTFFWVLYVCFSYDTVTLYRIRKHA